MKPILSFLLILAVLSLLVGISACDGTKTPPIDKKMEIVEIDVEEQLIMQQLVNHYRSLDEKGRRLFVMAIDSAYQRQQNEENEPQPMNTISQTRKVEGAPCDCGFWVKEENVRVLCPTLPYPVDGLRCDNTNLAQLAAGTVPIVEDCQGGNCGDSLGRLLRENPPFGDPMYTTFRFTNIPRGKRINGGGWYASANNQTSEWKVGFSSMKSFQLTIEENGVLSQMPILNYARK